MKTGQILHAVLVALATTYGLFIAGVWLLMQLMRP